MRFARVVAVHPESHSVDLVDTETGVRLAEVKVMGSSSGDTGSWSVPSVQRPTNDAEAGDVSSPGRDLIAAYSVVDDIRAIVHGFVTPNGSQTGMKQDDRSVSRHASGAYTTTAPDGSMELFHPSGTYFRVGAGEHEDLSAHSGDGTWTETTGAAAPSITLVTGGFKLQVSPGGVATINFASLKLTGPVTVEGELHVTGEVIAKFGGPSVTLSQHQDPQGGPPIPGT
jgi:hypothetical protein